MRHLLSIVSISSWPAFYLDIYLLGDSLRSVESHGRRHGFLGGGYKTGFASGASEKKNFCTPTFPNVGGTSKQSVGAY